jgi:two-component system sensor histidine kinase/response regulator
MTADAPQPSILVVDDTVEYLQLLVGVLGERGYKVRPVTNGRQALQVAARVPPDLILLDINMPEMDGYEVCAQLRATEALEDIPIIFLTALAETPDKLKAFSLGGADYITKPFQVEEMLARVRVHIALRRGRAELVKNYERLRALEQLRDDLVQMVVNDMRPRLAVLMDHLEFLKGEAREVMGEEALADVLTAIRASVGLSRMANDLLDVSRMEEGALPLTLEVTDLVALAQGVRSALAGWDRSRTIEVVASAPVETRCDRDVIQRVLQNLMNNAIKHTPARGRIWVTVAALDERVRVEVRDEGPGVPVETRAAIFEKFGTATVRKQRKYHSAGLGLAFCKLAVQAHHGAIGVDAGQPTGSVFWFELPDSMRASRGNG